MEPNITTPNNISNLYSSENLDKVFWTLLDKPHRLPVLLQIADRLTSGVFWTMFGKIWVDTESLYQNHTSLAKVLEKKMSPFDNFNQNSRSFEQHFCMPENDYIIFKKLTKRKFVTIYRGGYLDNIFGWAWTLDKEKARWFAKRCPIDGKPLLAIGLISGSDIIMYTDQRCGKEIVVDPKNIVNMDYIKLPEMEITPEQILFQNEQAGIGWITKSRETDECLRQLIWCKTGNTTGKINQQNLQSSKDAMFLQKELLNSMEITIRDEYINKMLRIMDELIQEQILE